MFSKLAIPAVALAALGSAQSSSATAVTEISTSTVSAKDVTSTVASTSGSSALTPTPDVSSTSTSASSGTASSPSGAVHSVAVGQGGLKFTPNSISAAVGDRVEFHFVGIPHSVTQGDFANPCQPSNSTYFNSGVIKSAGPTYTITVNSTDPIYYYCAVGHHCQAGMVGVINAPAGKGASEYAAGAAKAPNSTDPPMVQGGSLTNGTASSTSGSSMTSGAAPTGTSPSGSSSGSPSPSHTPSTGDASGSLKVGFLSVLLAATFMLFGNSS